MEYLAIVVKNKYGEDKSLEMPIEHKKGIDLTYYK